MSTTSLKLEKRVHIAGRFMDNNFYLQYLRYFDILAQVHSVVETRYGTWILRIWRAQRFGPEKYVKSREVRFFRVLQESFNKYIVPPEPKIAKAIEVYGKEMMMEIEVYDEHRDMLEALTSGDFVAVINVHYARGGAFDSLKLHGGSFYNRGIAKVPEHFPDPKFQSIKRKVERALEEIHNYEDYVEFVDQSKTASMQSCISTSTSSMPMPPKSIYHSQPVSRKYRSFAAARSAGKESFAQPCSKIIIGDLIAVDWFGKRDARKYHFLTHAHSDHCRQLDRRWGQKVFCSQKTAMILPQVMGYESNRDVPPGIIHPLDEDTPHQFEGFTVTLVDANHCPGSVMFVFEGDEIPGGRVLCTGDFRADANLMKLLEPEQKLHWMTQKKFETIYLDNTYLSLSVSFPDRVTAGLELFKKVQAHKGKNIYIPLHRLGREEMLEELSRQMMEPVMAYEEKKTMACTMSYFFEFGIKNEVRTIRVVKRNKWQLVEGEEHLDFVIFDVSMLHHMTTSDPMIEMHKHQVIRIPYSDHSSREEIIRFLKKLRFSAVVPCSKKVTQQELELMLACSNEKDVSLKACEEKLVIEHADEEGVMTNGKEESHRKKRDYYEKERDVEMDRIVEKTKELDVEQRSPLEPENIVEDVPIEEDYEDPANYSMNEAAMESTLEAMVESTVHHGLLAQDEDEEPGPSHNMNHLNLDLDMDLNLNLGLAMSPTPSPLAHTFSSSRNHNSHHQNHMPRHRHHSSHSQQDHVADIQIPGHLEIDDVSMFVERADEAHLHMRLNSPEEPPLETLHLNQWNQKIPEPRGLVFSPQYPQEIEANHVRIEEKRHITDERTQTVPTVEDTLHVLEQETQSDEPVMEPYVEPEVEHEDMDISESEPEEEPEKDPESVVEPTEVEQEDEEPEKQVEEQEEVPEDEEEILDETEVIPEEEEQVEEEEEIIEKVPTPSYENYQDAEDEMPETIIEPTVSHATIEEDQVEEEVAEEIPEEQQPTTSASVAIVVSSPLADEVTLNEHPIKIIEPAPTPSPSLSPPPPAPVEPTPSPTPTPTPTPTPSPTPSPEVKPKRRKGGRKKGTRRRGGKAAVKPPEKVLAMEEEGKEEEQQEEREKEKEEEKAEEEEEEVQEPKKVVTNGHREREMTVEDEEVEMEKAVEEEEEEQVETEPEPSPLHELWPAEELQHTELEIDEPEAEPEEPEYVEPEYVAEPEPEPEEEEEEDDDYEEEQEIERDLDKWSEGPPKSLKEAIARLQQPSSRRRQFAQ